MHLTETVIFLKNEANEKLWLFTSSIICYFNDSSSNFCTAYFLTSFSFFLTCSYSAFSGLSVRPSPLFVIIYLSLLIYLFSLSSSSMYISREKGIHCFRCYVSVLRTLSGTQEVLNQYLSIDEQTHDGVLVTCHSSMCNAFQGLEIFKSLFCILYLKLPLFLTRFSLNCSSFSL